MSDDLTPPGDVLEEKLDALLQVVREVDGLRRLEHVIPAALFWERPPGLPSGAELLWLVHLTDAYSFAPQLDRHPAEDSITPPDYADLLASHPCGIEAMDDLMEVISSSRHHIMDRLRGSSDSARNSWIETILSHDRRLLSALTERLYESGLGGQ